MFTTLDSSYSGSYAPYLITRAISTMDTINKGCVCVEEGIKKSHRIPRGDIKNTLRVRKTIHTDNKINGFDLDSRLILPKSIDAYQEVNPRDLEETNFAEQLSNTILDRTVPQTLESQLIQLFLDRSAEAIELCIWQGSEDYQTGNFPEDSPYYQLQFFNGFMVNLLNDPLVRLSSISPVTITSSNILSILDDLILQATKYAKALVSSEKHMKDMKFLMNVPTHNIYTACLRSTTFKGLALDERGYPKWAAFEVVPLAGMPDNTIIFCKSTDTSSSSLWVGMNSQKDWNVNFNRVTNHSETFAMSAKFKFGVNYAFGEEIFMYTTLTKDDFLAANKN